MVPNSKAEKARRPSLNMLSLHRCEFYTPHPRIQVLKQFFKQTEVFFFFFFQGDCLKDRLQKESTGSRLLVATALTTGTKARRHQRSPGKLLVPGHCPSAPPTPKKARQVRTGQASALLQGQIYTCKASVAPRSQPTSFPGPARLQPSPHHPPGPSSSETRFWPMVCSA